MAVYVYACQNKDSAVREQSSSGGIFWLLANLILDEQGVVFGAAYDKEWQVYHTYGETPKDVRKFMGSKYVQSRMGDSCQKVKEFLDAGRKVLFSGTPCQIAGLYAYLGRKPENLITIDLICHGVPSRRVWREYLTEICQGRKIQEISFRDKTEGWVKFSMKIDFTDGSTYQKNLQQDLYIKGFLQDIYLRPSCYECRFRGMERMADITLADFWGVEKYVPELFDDRGTSLVLVHSEAGKRMVDAIKNEIDMKKICPEIVKKENPSVCVSVGYPKKRSYFFKKKQLKKSCLHYLKKMTTDTVLQRSIKYGKYQLKRILKRFGIWKEQRR